MSHSWRHSRDTDRYWYVYRVSRDAVWSFSKLLETLTLVRIAYAHVWARVAGWVGKEEKHMYCCYAYRLYFLTCDMFKSSLRHIHDPVLSSLKMKGILSSFLHILREPPLYTTAPKNSELQHATRAVDITHDDRSSFHKNKDAHNDFDGARLCNQCC
jgi:hypothetical protein